MVIYLGAMGIKPFENIFPWINNPQTNFTMTADLLGITSHSPAALVNTQGQFIPEFEIITVEQLQLLMSNSPLSLEQAITEFPSTPFRQKSILEEVKLLTLIVSYYVTQIYVKILICVCEKNTDSRWIRLTATACTPHLFLLQISSYHEIYKRFSTRFMVYASYMHQRTYNHTARRVYDCCIKKGSIGSCSD